MSWKTVVRSDWGLCLGLVLLLGTIYGLLSNPYWSPAGGDDAAYVAIARSLFNGEGFRFNGYPELVIAPGWPIVLALAMKISPTFAMLNLLATLFLLATVFTWYWIVRRFASPRASFVIVLLCSTLLAVHWWASHLYTEPLFSLLLGVVLLLAFQIREGRGSPAWRIALLGLLAAALVAVRLAGLLMVPMLAGIVLSGQWRPAANRGWLAALVVVTAMAGMFVYLRCSNWRDALPGQLAATRATGTDPVGTDAGDASVAPDGRPLPPAANDMLQPPMVRLSSRSTGRLACSGEWFAKLLWPVGNSGRGMGPVRLLSVAIGTLLMVPLGAMLVDGSRRREWIWIGLGIYCLYFIATWLTANERYFVPIAMLLVVGMYRGADVLTAGDAAGHAARPGAGPAAVVRRERVCLQPGHAGHQHMGREGCRLLHALPRRGVQGAAGGGHVPEQPARS